jgi:hypothetical protein
VRRRKRREGLFWSFPGKDSGESKISWTRLGRIRPSPSSLAPSPISSCHYEESSEYATLCNATALVFLFPNLLKAVGSVGILRKSVESAETSKPLSADEDIK